MKRFIFILCTAGLLAACNTNNPEPEEPQKPNLPDTVNAQTCKDVILRYFPYSPSEMLTFQNSQTGEDWQISPRIKDMSEDFPAVTITEGISTSDDWYLDIEAYFMKAGDDYHHALTCCGLSCTIFPTLRGDTIEIRWSGLISLTGNYEDKYIATWLTIKADSANVLKHLTDTLTIQLEKPQTVLPPEVCMHVVRERGITDFSLDGKTIWNRVK